MTITVAPARNEYTANAGQTIFNYTFKIFENTDLNVYVTPAGQECSDSDLTTAYTVSGIGDPAGGSITLSTPTSDGDLVTIVSDILSERKTDYQNNGDFRSDTVNEDFDRVVSIVKKIEDKVSRSPALPECFQGDKPLKLSPPEAGKSIIFDGSKFENYSPATVLPEVPQNQVVGNFTNYTFNNISDAKIGLTSGGFLVDLKAGDCIKTLGYFTRNDGGGSDYVVVLGGTGTEDGGSYHNTVNGLQLELLSGGVVNVKQFGAIADGVTDSSSSFQNALNYTGKVRIPEGTYVASFDLNNQQVIEGDGAKNRTKIIAPSGASYVIRVDAKTTPKQHCQIRDLQIANDQGVPNCTGILFDGVNVNSINDWHTVRNVYMTNFNSHIEVKGRQIWSSFYNVECSGGVNGLIVASDPSTPAYNQNTFFQCRFTNLQKQCVKITGQNATNAFYTCDFENSNTSSTAGLATVEVEDSESLALIGGYFENNGVNVPLDNSNLSNNSFAIKLGGSYCYNTTIEPAWMVSSGIMVWVAASVRGGKLGNARLTPISGGYAILISSALAFPNAPQFCVDSSIFTDGKIEIQQDVNGQYAGRVNQNSATYWMTSDIEIDLLQTSKIMANPNGGSFTGISSISNRISGMELTVYNENGSNDLTIDSSLIYRGSGVISPRTSKKYIVGGFPANGRLVEV